jgi:hypothetical protein
VNLSATVFINRCARDVFGSVIDVPHYAPWRSGVVETSFTSDGTVDVGTARVDRIEANGRELVSHWTISELEPGRLAKKLKQILEQTQPVESVLRDYSEEFDDSTNH